MQKYNLVEKKGSYWKLTDQGNSFLFYLQSLDDNNIIIQQKENRKKTFGKQKEDTFSPKRPKQVSIEPWLQNSCLDDVEKVVVEVLVDHCNQTGSKFVFSDGIYDLATKFRVNPSDLPQALRRLVEDNIIYVWHPKGGNYVKIGIKKAFLEALETNNR
jgi:hypothetical protein